MSLEKYGMSKGAGVPKAKHFGFSGFAEKLKEDLNPPKEKKIKVRKDRPIAPKVLAVAVQKALDVVKNTERDLDKEAEQARVRYQARLLAGLWNPT